MLSYVSYFNLKTNSSLLCLLKSPPFGRYFSTCSPNLLLLDCFSRCYFDPLFVKSQNNLGKARKDYVTAMVKWLDYKTCNHKVVGSKPAKLTTNFTMTRISFVV